MLHAPDRRVTSHFVSTNGLSICGLVETKLAVDRISHVADKIWRNFSHVHNGTSTQSCRILIWWDHAS